MCALQNSVIVPGIQELLRASSPDFKAQVLESYNGWSGVTGKNKRALYIK